MYFVFCCPLDNSSFITSVKLVTIQKLMEHLKKIKIQILDVVLLYNLGVLDLLRQFEVYAYCKLLLSARSYSRSHFFFFVPVSLNRIQAPVFQFPFLQVNLAGVFWPVIPIWAFPVSQIPTASLSFPLDLFYLPLWGQGKTWQ